MFVLRWTRKEIWLLNGQSLASETLEVAQIQHSIPLHSIKRVTVTLVRISAL